MTIFKKSLLTLGLATMGFSVVLVATIMVFMNSLYYETNVISLKNTARTLMTTIGMDSLIEIFSANMEDRPIQISMPLSDRDPYRLTLVAPSGYVLWDSHVAQRLVNHINREEIIAALEGREGSSSRESLSTNMRRIYYALPVFNYRDEAIGVFRLSIAIPGFMARLSPILPPFIVFISIFIFTIFWVIILFSRSLSASLERLVNIAQSSTLLLSVPDVIQHITPEFMSVEKAMHAMKEELILRFEQVKAEGSRLQAILNGMSEAVFAMDSSLKLHLVNPKAKKLFNLENVNVGTAPARTINGGTNSSAMSLLEATRSSELVEIAKKSISDGIPIEKELSFHSGAEQHFQVYASPLARTNGNGDCGGVVLVLQEITRLVKLERVRKDFVANVSHELRTPIQLVKGFSETLLDTITDNDKENKKQIIHFIEIIYKNAGIMENLTNDLLILASLENGDSKIYDMGEFSVASIIEEAVSSVEPQAKKKQTEIIINCTKDLRAKFYGTLIIQALINLIDNGIKYSSSKSKLWVNGKLNDDKTKLIFEVRDKGMGIPAEHLQRIFERFYRVDRARSREAGGTGLGLSIVRHIALLHKGSAEAESHAGEGSIFRIIIPLHLPQYNSSSKIHPD